MAREYFQAYHSYLEIMTELTDAEKGRLFTACLLYSKTGEAPQLSGNERFVFPAFRSQIDRDNMVYDKKCATNKKNGELGGKRTGANGTERGQTVPNGGERPPNAPQGKGKGEGEGKGEGDITPHFSPLEGVSPELSDAFASWLAYKRERRESYKPTGFKSLVTQVKNAAGEYGDHEVAELIRDCMASGWSGIIFDRLRKGGGSAQVPRQQQRRPSFAEIAERMDEREGL